VEIIFSYLSIENKREEVIKAIEEIGSGGKNPKCYRVNR